MISSDTYDAGALYGYMNGGSELYHEYGFRELTVKEVEVDENTLTLEYFSMEDGLCAYGIYGVNVHKCQSTTNNSGIYTCHNPYQLQAVVGHYYLSFINGNGSQSAQDASQKLLDEFISRQDSIQTVTLPSYVTRHNPSEALYLCGHLGIENRASKWLPYFDFFRMDECWLLKWSNTKATMLVVELKKMNPSIKFLDFTIREDAKYEIRGKIVGEHFLIIRMLKDDIYAQEVFSQMAT